MKKTYLLLLCLLATAAGAAVSEYLEPRLLPMLRHRGIFQKSSRNLSTSQLVVIQDNPESTSAETAYPEEVVSPMEIRELFETKNFNTLTARLEGYQARFEKDFRYEYHIYDAFQAFESTRSDYDALFDAWRQTAPDSFTPHLARAIYYRTLGSSSRGTKWAKDTSDGQFAGMRYHYERAEQEALAAVKINPKAVRAVTILINIRMNYSDREALKVLEEHASRVSPYALIFRKNYMLSLLPRWGGSYEAMDDYVRSCEKYFRYNPRLAVLKGYAFSDQAFYYRRDQNYQKAIDLYTQALSFGPEHNYLRERGRTYYQMKDYDSALIDLNQAVSLRPTIVENLNLRSSIHFAMGRYEAALQDLDSALKIQPTDSKILKSRRWCCDNFMNKGHNLFKTDKNGAVERYTMALRFDPEAAEVMYWRGVAYANLGKFGLAKEDIGRSIKLNPSHFESYQTMDSLLAREWKWEEIISYWDAFLQLNPDHADALLERGGTYYHSGDMELALRDFQRSCELGNSTACALYRKMH